jgi:hypothetical protein
MESSHSKRYDERPGIRKDLRLRISFDGFEEIMSVKGEITESPRAGVVKGGWSLRGSAAIGWWRVATGVTARMQDSGTGVHCNLPGAAKESGQE